jgi:hypothetical protein
MTSDKQAPPVSGSDDARSADSGQADKDRNEAVATAERALHRKKDQLGDTDTANAPVAKE